jgi:crotonobetainyl-CoA:carnitine CoA-transferase CaiB-like acyl-CoA transferase
VVDFSTHLPGPVASHHLVQLGANVIKVEHPKWGDGNRDVAPYFEGEGIHHLALNPGTRSLTLDSKSPQWPQIVQALAQWADVIIVGNRPSTAQRLGLDFQTLLRHNPQLVYCLISGYGLSGGWAGYPAHGLNVDALAGTIALEQHDGRPDTPEHSRSVGTTMAGIEAALGIYAALYQRSLGGGGQVVHVSIWEAALSWMWRDTATFANTGTSWPAYRSFGSRYAIYGALDGKALLVCPTEKHFWERFCDALELSPELRGRGDWSSGSDMGARYLALGERDVIQARFATRTRDEWVAILARADIPFAPVLDWREAMQSGHAAENGVMATYEHHGKPIRVPASPVSVTPAQAIVEQGYEGLAAAHRSKADAGRPAPGLGEHTAEILRELGIAP